MPSVKKAIKGIAEHLRRVKETGALTAELADIIGVSLQHCSKAIKAGTDDGVFAWHIDAAPKAPLRRRWYLTEYRPNHPPPRSLPSVAVVVVKPEEPRKATVTVQQGPVFRDTRFTFDPPLGWVGEITRDWQERRGQG